LWLFGQFAATGSSAASYQQAEQPVSQLINDFGPPVASSAAARQRAAMPFVHLERDLWDLRDAAAPAPAPRPFPRPTQLRQTFPRRRRLPQSAGLAQSADRRYSAMGVLGSAIGLITPIAPTLSAAASAISAISQSAGGR